MQLGLIGLGRMGKNMVRRLLQDNYEVVVYNRTLHKVKEMEKEGAAGSYSIQELVDKLSVPRKIWLMLPAGDIVEQHIKSITPFLDRGDILIDGGNSYFKDDIRRSKELGPQGIYYLDAGVSGGVWGLEYGYCIMVGGHKEAFNSIEPVLKSLAPKEGYLYCGPAGAGHFVKMVHNAIEYAMMEAYGEGFELLDASPYQKNLDYHRIAHLWNRGSVIRSWLLELLERAFKKDPHLEKIEGYVEDSGEGRWSVMQAVESGVSATSIAHALFKRFQSRQKDLFSNRILAALRNEFGGHQVKEKTK
ncbi:MAG: phosphogluconate dehydrogenase (NAD(+)-dependent, decarboxylating) [Spirochaetota bacterium]